MSAIVLGTSEHGFIHHPKKYSGEQIAFANVQFRTYPLDTEDCINLYYDLQYILKEKGIIKGE